MAGEARRSEAEEGARGREAGARLALLDALLNALSDLGEGVFVHDGERIIYVNEAEARNTGYGVEELAAMPGLGGRAAKGLEEQVARRVSVPLGRGFSGRVAAERRPIIVEHVGEVAVLSPRLREAGIRSLLGVPLLVEGQAIGVVHVGSLETRRFTEDETRLLQLVAERA